MGLLAFYGGVNSFGRRLHLVFNCHLFPCGYVFVNTNFSFYAICGGHFSQGFSGFMGRVERFDRGSFHAQDGVGATRANGDNVIEG